ncbi:hypothetical protein CDAR_372041 [Caerostris darwini]|uniref:Uncharacterized protein n=1 Tax=Caerostris darwini TaxID=1538125 RepID=A0AAV4VXG5_9ARAC|nr:hypothetical protein CDAR_372041 [Caerostris darwini]
MFYNNHPSHLIYNTNTQQQFPGEESHKSVKQKLLTMKSCLLAVFLWVAVLAVVVGLSRAAPHHHRDHDRREAVEMLAAGLIAKMLSEIHG